MPKSQSASQKPDRLKPKFEKIKADDKVLVMVELTKSRGLGTAPDYYKI